MKIESIDRNHRAFHVSWQDGSTSELPFIWLRDNDPNELHPDTHERTFDLSGVDLDISPLNYNFNGENGGELSISWPNKTIESKYSAHWIHQHRPGIRRHDPARIQHRSWAEQKMDSLPRFDAQKCHQSRFALLGVLESLKTTGIVLIHNLNDDVNAGEKFGDLIGFKRQTNYGVVFEVKSKPKPNNLAYTSLALPLHTDLANQESVPGNQFLHCFRNQATGGGSIFADALSIINDFKRDHPDHYQLLCEVPVPWHFVDDESDIRYHRPVIGLNAHGVFTGLTFNAHLADVPDFDTDLMYDFYAAFRELMVSIRTTTYKLEYSLNNGEMVIFDNQRILHGRTAFDPSSGARHLRGYYIEHNEVDNRIRMLAK